MKTNSKRRKDLRMAMTTWLEHQTILPCNKSLKNFSEFLHDSILKIHWPKTIYGQNLRVLAQFPDSEI
jgi:hypothetical protein